MKGIEPSMSASGLISTAACHCLDRLIISIFNFLLLQGVLNMNVAVMVICFEESVISIYKNPNIYQHLMNHWNTTDVWATKSKNEKEDINQIILQQKNTLKYQYATVSFLISRYPTICCNESSISARTNNLKCDDQSNQHNWVYIPCDLSVASLSKLFTFPKACAASSYFTSLQIVNFAYPVPQVHFPHTSISHLLWTNITITLSSVNIWLALAFYVHTIYGTYNQCKSKSTQLWACCIQIYCNLTMHVIP